MSGVSTSAKVQRLLAIVPWVVERGGATVSEIAERFETTPCAVYDLLAAAMCYEVVGTGMHDNLGIVVFGSDDLNGGARDRRGRDSAHGEAWVHVEPGAMLHRPLNLSVPQAFGVLVAGQSALSLRGADRSGALATALEKLSAVYGERVRVSVELAPPRFLDVLNAVLEAGTTVRIRYYTPNSDEVSERFVDPASVLFHEGHWYVRGWCHLRTDLRSFRVDRIEECQDTRERHGRPTDLGDAAFVAPAEADGAVDVVLSIPADDLWRVEAYPPSSVEPDGDRCTVTYAVLSPRVLQQMLLRLGSATRIVNAADLPAELRDAGRTAAEAILELYPS